MNLDSNLTGTRLKGLTREVTWRDTMNFAAAVSDVNPRYFDDTAEDGIVAPPLFAVALTWPFIVNVQQQLPDLLPMELVVNMVHATEHLLFHRPVRPGDRLEIGGRVAAVVPSRSGTLMVLKLEAPDTEGRPVFTEYGGAFFRGVGCAGQGRGRETLPELPRWAPLPAPIWSAEVPVPAEAAHVYDGCTNIVFGIHTSRAFARSVGLPQPIYQGTATLAIAAREIVNREVGGVPERLTEISCRFAGMVAPGTTIRVEAVKSEPVPEGRLLSFRVLNSEGRPAIQKGFARLAG